MKKIGCVILLLFGVFGLTEAAFAYTRDYGEIIEGDTWEWNYPPYATNTVGLEGQQVFNVFDFSTTTGTTCGLGGASGDSITYADLDLPTYFAGCATGTLYLMRCDLGVQSGYLCYYYSSSSLGYIQVYKVSETEFVYNEENSYDYPYIVSLTDTDFSPTLPHDCQFSVYSTSSATNFDFTVLGTFTNGASSTITYDDFKIYFYDDSQNATSINITACEPSTPNSGCTWSGTSTLPNDNYRVEYVATGYDKDGSPRIYRHYCKGTGIGISLPTGPIDWWGTRSDICTFNDCSGYGWVGDFGQRLWCEIENLTMKLVCPTPEVLERSWSAIDSLKQSFPFSYISATRDVFSSTETGISTSSTSTVVMGYTGTRGLNDYKNLKDTFVTSSGKNLLSTLRSVTTGLLLLLFGFWIVKYAAKEFFT